MALKIFACHKSTDEHPPVCAGFLLRGAAHNLSVRLAFARGEINPHAVSDFGYPLFPSYVAMAVANGVRADHPALALCRDDDARSAITPGNSGRSKNSLPK
jgi:hypothetical protein